MATFRAAAARLDNPVELTVTENGCLFGSAVGAMKLDSDRCLIIRFGLYLRTLLDRARTSISTGTFERLMRREWKNVTEPLYITTNRIQ